MQVTAYYNTIMKRGRREEEIEGEEGEGCGGAVMGRDRSTALNTRVFSI